MIREVKEPPSKASVTRKPISSGAPATGAGKAIRTVDCGAPGRSTRITFGPACGEGGRASRSGPPAQLAERLLDRGLDRRLVEPAGDEQPRPFRSEIGFVETAHVGELVAGELGVGREEPAVGMVGAVISGGQRRIGRRLRLRLARRRRCAHRPGTPARIRTSGRSGRRPTSAISRTASPACSVSTFSPKKVSCVPAPTLRLPPMAAAAAAMSAPERPPAPSRSIWRGEHRQADVLALVEAARIDPQADHRLGHEAIGNEGHLQAVGKPVGLRGRDGERLGAPRRRHRRIIVFLGGERSCGEAERGERRARAARRIISRLPGLGPPRPAGAGWTRRIERLVGRRYSLAVASRSSGVTASKPASSRLTQLGSSSHIAPTASRSTRPKRVEGSARL